MHSKIFIERKLNDEIEGEYYEEGFFNISNWALWAQDCVHLLIQIAIISKPHIIIWLLLIILLFLKFINSKRIKKKYLNKKVLRNIRENIYFLLNCIEKYYNINIYYLKD